MALHANVYPKHFSTLAYLPVYNQCMVIVFDEQFAHLNCSAVELFKSVQHRTTARRQQPRLLLGVLTLLGDLYRLLLLHDTNDVNALDQIYCTSLRRCTFVCWFCGRPTRKHVTERRDAAMVAVYRFSGLPKRASRGSSLVFKELQSGDKKYGRMRYYELDYWNSKNI